MEAIMSTQATQPGPCYIYVEMKIHDPQRFKEYTSLSAPAVKAAGGRYAVAGARPLVVEGSFDADRVVVVEFPTTAQARAFYESAAYQQARQKRFGAADFKVLLLEGSA
jgi:uncharacterized protein (DUF1330 family)